MEEIEKIEKMAKKDRVVKIGKLMRSNPEFNKGLKAAFVDIRKRFFDANEIEDEDILSVKKDAIFCIGDKVKVTKFGFCTFVPKNTYTSYMYINKFEFYYRSPALNANSDAVIDVKGIDDMVVDKHINGMLQFLGNVFRKCESGNTMSALKYIKRFASRYKRRELPIDYYRELDQMSIFRLEGEEETYDDIVFIPYENKTDVVDITYNYFSIIVPIASMLV
jgi:hypothetical protein